METAILLPLWTGFIMGNLKMGMTIDEALEHGKEQIEIFGGEHKEFIECALSTMRKYQKMQGVLDKVRAEIKEWYWQADKQALAKDPCVVDAMIDLFIRTIDKYKAESEDEK